MAKRKNEFGWKNHESYFTGTICGKNVFDLTKIDYNLVNSKERLEYLENLIKECDGFLNGYFYGTEEREPYYKFNPRTWKDVLSHDVNVCMVLETLATYLLNSRDLPLERQQQYKIYTNEELFKAAQKELSSKSKVSSTNTENEVIEFLLRQTKSNSYFSKDTVIKPSDFKDTEKDLGKILMAYDLMYQHLREHARKLKNGEPTIYSVTKIKRLMSGLKDDMILAKEKIKRPIEIENNGDFSPITDWLRFDFKNIDHVKAILYFKPRSLAPEDDLSILIYDVNNIIKNLFKLKQIDKTDLEILDMIRSEYTLTEIAKELGYSGKTSIFKRFNRIAEKIVKYSIEKGL